MVKINLKKKKDKESFREMDFSHVEDVAKDFIEEIMSKDWREMLGNEIEKIRKPKKGKKKLESISLIAAFAIGYMLGSLRGK